MRSLTTLLWGFPAEHAKEIRKTVYFLMFLSFLFGGAAAAWGIVVFIRLAGA